MRITEKKILFLSSFLLLTTSFAANAQRIPTDSTICNEIHVGNNPECNFINQAYYSDSSFVLTNNKNFQLGAVWRREKVKIQSGFTTEFSFKISNPYFGGIDDGGYVGADGLAFVIQSQSDSAIGIAGGCMGYYLIENAIVVEFDQYKNSEEDSVAWNDPSGNHIALQYAKNSGVSGMHNADNSVIIAETDIKPNGTEYFCKVDYDSVGQSFDVFLATDPKNYGEPILSVSEFEINKHFELKNGYAYMGFTAATGRSSETHEILSWKICEKNIADRGECDSSYFKYSDFANTNELYFKETPQVFDNKIRMTDTTRYATAAIWRKNTVPVINGFETIFKFSLSDSHKGKYPDSSQDGADGIAFVVHNDPKGIESIGKNGGGIGYDGLRNAVAFEIDLFANNEYQLENKNDPDGCHFAVMTSTKGELLSSTHYQTTDILPAKNLNVKADGTPYYCKIKYISQRNQLFVWISENRVFDVPIMYVNDFDLTKYIDLKDSVFAYVGFTAATGDASQNQDLHEWSFCPGFYSYKISGIDNNDEKKYWINQTSAGISININSKMNNASVEIFNLQGEKVWSDEIKENLYCVDNNIFTNGIYYIYLYIDGNIYFDKILIQK